MKPAEVVCRGWMDKNPACGGNRELKGRIAKVGKEVTVRAVGFEENGHNPGMI